MNYRYENHLLISRKSKITHSTTVQHATEYSNKHEPANIIFTIFRQIGRT